MCSPTARRTTPAPPEPRSEGVTSASPPPSATPKVIRRLDRCLDSLGRLGVITGTPPYLTASLACLVYLRPLVLTDQRREEDPMAVAAEPHSMPIQQDPPD